MKEMPENMAQVERRKNYIFPERAFVGIDESIDKIKKIESGEIPKLELTQQERERLLEFENGLGEQMEKIFDIKVNTLEIYPEFFLTDEGKKLFLEVTGFAIIATDEDEVLNFFFENRQQLMALGGKKQAKLSGESRTYVQDKELEILKSTRD